MSNQDDFSKAKPIIEMNQISATINVPSIIKNNDTLSKLLDLIESDGWSKLHVSKDSTEYYINKDCKYHRLDGPAIKYINGSEEYHIDGKQLTLEDFYIHPDCKAWPRLIFTSFGKTWKNKEGEYHREDGPAIENSAEGTKWWYQNGKQHRLDGPALEWESGIKLYWIDGECLSEEEFYSHPDCTIERK